MLFLNLDLQKIFKKIKNRFESIVTSNFCPQNASKKCNCITKTAVKQTRKEMPHNTAYSQSRCSVYIRFHVSTLLPSYASEHPVRIAQSAVRVSAYIILYKYSLCDYARKRKKCLTRSLIPTYTLQFNTPVNLPLTLHPLREETAAVTANRPSTTNEPSSPPPSSLLLLLSLSYPHPIHSSTAQHCVRI